MTDTNPDPAEALAREIDALVALHLEGAFRKDGRRGLPHTAKEAERRGGDMVAAMTLLIRAHDSALVAQYQEKYERGVRLLTEEERLRYVEMTRAEAAEARCKTLEAERETLEGKLAEAECEIRGIDAVLARRPALDRPTRRENIEKALAFCAKADAEVADLRRKLQAAEGRLYRAWGVIANVSGGDWIQQPATWRQAAQHWRDDWHETLDAARQAEEKP